MPLFNIGFVIFRDVTQLDFTGPLQVLSRLPQSIAVAAAATKYLDRPTLAALGRSLGNANAYRRAAFLYCPCDDGLRRLGPHGFSACGSRTLLGFGDALIVTQPLAVGLAAASAALVRAGIASRSCSAAPAST